MLLSQNFSPINRTNQEAYKSIQQQFPMRNKTDAIQIFPVGVADNLQVNSLLDKNKQPYFTYLLSDEKTLRSVWSDIS